MRAVVGIGSNLGSRCAFIRASCALMAGLPGLRLHRLSSIVETDAVGPPQPRFLNAAALIETSESGPALLEQLLTVERRLGRIRDIPMGPRTIDLDLLWADGPPISTPTLTVPHPRLTERPFALAPLLELVRSKQLAERLDELGGAPAPYTWTAVQTRAGREVIAGEVNDAIALCVGADPVHMGGRPCTVVERLRLPGGPAERLAGFLERHGPGSAALALLPAGAETEGFVVRPAASQGRADVLVSWRAGKARAGYKLTGA